MRLLPTAILLAALVQPALAQPDFDAIKLAAGAQIFTAACGGCHAEGANGAIPGPPLENVAGRIAGSWIDYDYSDALAVAGFVWTDAALRAWMEDNTAFLPGSRMRHDGISDPVVQDLILVYLHSISQGE